MSSTAIIVLRVLLTLLILVPAWFVPFFVLLVLASYHPLPAGPFYFVLGGVIGMAYVFYALWIFHFLIKYLVRLSPYKGAMVRSKEALLGQIADKFSQAQDQAGRPLFDVQESENSVIIRWSGDIGYFQGGAAGLKRKERMFKFSLDEASRTVRVKTASVNADLGADLSGVGGSYSWHKGFELEWTSTYIPSITLNEQGVLAVDHRKLTYDARDIWEPAQEIIRRSGWSIEIDINEALSLKGRLEYAMWALLLIVGFIIGAIAGQGMLN